LFFGKKQKKETDLKKRGNEMRKILVVVGVLAALGCVTLSGCLPLRCGGQNMMVCV
jgi:hypothetical protein